MTRKEQVMYADMLLHSGVLSEESANAIKADFPELAESEDERIRKEILALVKKHAINHERCQMEAYLEKQKEQKVDIDKLRKDLYQSGYNDGYQHGEEDAHKEQKLAEWSEEDDEVIDNIICVLQKDVTYTPPTRPNSCTGSGNAFYTHQTEIDWLKSLHPQPHWEPSEEQMCAFKLAMIPMRDKHNASVSGIPAYDTLCSLYYDLKSL